MEKLFGIPLNQLMLALIVLFLVGGAVVAIAAVRNRVVFQMAARNIPRRRAQTVLIVIGLMLATLLFSASFSTGDTLAHSLRIQAVRDLGPVDLLVRSEVREQGGRLPAFDASWTARVRDALSGVSEVEAVAPLLRERVPVVAADDNLNEPRVDVLGLDMEWVSNVDPLRGAGGETLSLASLGAGEVFVSSELADKIGVAAGETILVFLGRQPASLRVAGVYTEGASPASELSIALSLPQLQALTGSNDRINTVLISNRGDIVSGALHTETVSAAVEPLLEESGLSLEPVKQEALDEADETGSLFSTIFLVFGQFSIAAGVMLIFLLFVMLAAERQRELGIARAVGMQRRHLVLLFAFEGVLYALMAAAVGSILGVGVGWGMVRIIGAAFGQFDIDIVFSFNWRTVVIAFTLGMGLTFLIVLVASVRASRLNIIRAIRDIPEPKVQRLTVKGLVVAVLIPIAGVLLAASGIQSAQAGLFMLGTSLLIIGIPLVARRFGLPERGTFSTAGLGLVIWWLIPEDWFDRAFPFLPDFNQGIEMFFLSGIMIVLGGVWAVIYNADIVLRMIVFLFGRFRGLPPVLKTAVSYPMQNRFRTGVTLAMFSLVVFTLMVMAFIIQALGSVWEDTQAISGGYDIQGVTTYANPIQDIRTSLAESDSIGVDAFTAIGSFATIPVKMKQADTEQELVDFGIRGADESLINTVGYGFSMMAEGYESDEQVWAALRQEQNTAVVAAWMVPSRTDFNVGDSGVPLQFEGFYSEDETLPEVYLLIQDLQSGREERLRIIGVLRQTAFYAGSIITSMDSLGSFLGTTPPPQTYLFRLDDGRDAEETARALRLSFLQNGMQTEIIEEEIRKNASANLMLNNLLQGFMSLGLVVGIAALGVIAARSVVERRQQIGVLRALGFQREMVQASFLIESSFVALLGVAIGVALGFALSIQIVDSIAQDLEGARFSVPWLNVVLVVVVAYGASLLTTFIPARQAANVYPAEALRFAE